MLKIVKFEGGVFFILKYLRCVLNCRLLASVWAVSSDCSPNLKVSCNLQREIYNLFSRPTTLCVRQFVLSWWSYNSVSPSSWRTSMHTSALWPVRNRIFSLSVSFLDNDNLYKKFWAQCINVCRNSARHNSLLLYLKSHIFNGNFCRQSLTSVAPIFTETKAHNDSRAPKVKTNALPVYRADDQTEHYKDERNIKFLWFKWKSFEMKFPSLKL